MVLYLVLRMSAVTKINPHLSTIQAPELIASRPIWLMWRFEHLDGEVKPRKVPYYANGAKRYGVQGRPEDRQQLVTFDAARAAAARKNMDGIGLATLDGDFSVLDFDKCMVNGRLHHDIEGFGVGTYAEYSPSGEGVHVFVLGNVAGNQKSHASATQFGVEGFATKGFVTFTGNTLEITELTEAANTIAAPDTRLTALLRSRFGEGLTEEDNAQAKQPLGLSLEIVREALDVLDPSTDHNTWLSIGMALHHETNGQGFALWNTWSSASEKYPGEEALLSRWDSFGKGNAKIITARTLVQLANQNGAHINLNVTNLEEFDNLDSKTVSTKNFRFEVIPWHLFAVQTSHAYLIKGVLPKATLGVLFGESGSGKSFITLDMCIAIAMGASWRGNRTTQGRVVYIVAEGAGGFRNRLIAFAKHHNLDPSTIPLDIIDAAPNLLAKEDAIEVAKAIKHSGANPSLVVVDTLAQAMAGANENASEDLGKAIAHCKGIHIATSAMVLLVHHAGKDSSKGARGWSGLRAAADVELEVTRNPMGRSLRTTKQKDGADFQEWGFDLEVVPIGEDQDGDIVTSCICVEAAVPVKDKDERLSENDQAVLNALSEIALAQTAGIEIVAVTDLAASYFEGLSPEQFRNKKRTLRENLKKFYLGDDAMCTLQDDKTLTINGDFL